MDCLIRFVEFTVSFSALKSFSHLKSQTCPAVAQQEHSVKIKHLKMKRNASSIRKKKKDTCLCDASSLIKSRACFLQMLQDGICFAKYTDPEAKHCVMAISQLQR